MATAPYAPMDDGHDPEAQTLFSTTIQPMASAIGTELQKDFTRTMSLYGFIQVLNSFLLENSSWATSLGIAGITTITGRLTEALSQYFDPEEAYIPAALARGVGEALAGGISTGFVLGSAPAGAVAGGALAARHAGGMAFSHFFPTAPVEEGAAEPTAASSFSVEAAKTLSGAALGGATAGLVKQAMTGELGQAVQTGALVFAFFAGLKTIFTNPELESQVSKFLHAGFGAMGIVNLAVEVIPPVYSEAALAGADHTFPGIVGAALVGNMATSAILQKQFGWTPQTAGMVSAVVEAILVSTVGTELLRGIGGGKLAEGLAVTIPFALGILANQTPELFAKLVSLCSTPGAAATASSASVVDSHAAGTAPLLEGSNPEGDGHTTGQFVGTLTTPDSLSAPARDPESAAHAPGAD